MALEDMRLGLRPPSRRLVLFGFRRLRVARHNGINGLVSGRVVQAVLSKSEADHQYDVAAHPSDLTNTGCMEKLTILLYLLLAPFLSRCRHSLLAGGHIMRGVIGVFQFAAIRKHDYAPYARRDALDIQNAHQFKQL